MLDLLGEGLVGVVATESRDDGGLLADGEWGGWSRDADGGGWGGECAESGSLDEVPGRMSAHGLVVKLAQYASIATAGLRARRSRGAMIYVHDEGYVVGIGLEGSDGG